MSNISIRLIDNSFNKSEAFETLKERIDYLLNSSSQLVPTIMSADSGSMFGRSIASMASHIKASVGDNQSLESSHIDSYVVCHNRSHLAFTTAQQLSLQICMIASIISFLIHLSVYGFVPKLQSLPGKCLMSLSLSLLALNLFLIISYNIETSSESMFCVVVGVAKHYFTLVAFCWMSVLAFDTHWTFHLPNRNHPTNALKGYHKRTSLFIKYSIYSWLTPALLVGVAVSIDSVTEADLSVKPMYGKVVCGMSQLMSILVWGTIPCCLILLFNIIFFAKTLTKLNRITGETELANKATFRERFLWCFKLAIFLGIAWIIQFISTFVCEIWFQYFAQLFLSCQGLIILSITTLKRSVFELTKRRLFYLKNPGLERQQSSRRSFQATASLKAFPVF